LKKRGYEIKEKRDENKRPVEYQVLKRNGETVLPGDRDANQITIEDLN
jgi:hypothetical protein